MASETSKIFKVGVIVGSTRPKRAGPQISTFVSQIIEQHEAAQAAENRPRVSLTLIDIAALNLPFLDEPMMAKQITNPADYTHAHTRAWAATVSALDAFVFVTPQYNWGIPAALKNAIDFLFHEWVGKPAMVVSYGGHGGDKSAAALALVLGGGIGVKVAERRVNLTFPGRPFMIKAATGQELALDPRSDDGPWADKKADIVASWEDVVQMLAEQRNVV